MFDLLLFKSLLANLLWSLLLAESVTSSNEADSATELAKDVEEVEVS